MQRTGSTIKAASARQISAININKESIKVIQNKEYQRTKAVWPDPTGINPPDWRLSMPGNTGIISDQQRDLTKNINLDEFVQAAKEFYVEKKIQSIELEDPNDLPERASKSLTDAIIQTQIDCDKDFVGATKDLKEAVEGVCSLSEDFEKISKSIQSARATSGEIEISSNKLPELLAGDVKKIFLKDFGAQINYRRNIGMDKAVFDKDNQKINTIVNLAFKTKNSMAGWNDTVQQERFEKIDTFIDIAQKISLSLISEGYFADFLDPTTGKPWFSNKENDEKLDVLQVFETNDGFDGLGNLHIEDLGCCKVLAHRAFGVNVFVGSLVSNCPEDHPLLVKLAGFKEE